MSNTRDKLNSILLSYDEIASSDPMQLRLALPSNDIWRFFIDGEKQESGRGLKLLPAFQAQPFYYSFFYKNPLDYNVVNYLVDIEHASYQDEDGWYGSQLLADLYECSWNLEQDEYEKFQLIDLLIMDRAWLPFERNEPGYLKALCKAFPAIFDFQSPITIDFVQRLHQLATCNVLNIGHDDDRLLQLNKFRAASKCGYGLSNTNMSTDGLLEFIQGIKNDYQSLNNTDLCIYQTFGGAQGFKINGKCLALIESLSNADDNNFGDAELCEHFKEFITAKNDHLRNCYVKDVLPLIKELLLSNDNKSIAVSLYKKICKNKGWFTQESEQSGDTNK